MKDNLVVPLKGNIQVRNKPYITEQKIYDEIMGVVDSHAGTVSLVAMIGILDLVKTHVRENQYE